MDTQMSVSHKCLEIPFYYIVYFIYILSLGFIILLFNFSTHVSVSFGINYWGFIICFDIWCQRVPSFLIFARVLLTKFRYLFFYINFNIMFPIKNGYFCCFYWIMLNLLIILWSISIIFRLKLFIQDHVFFHL